MPDYDNSERLTRFGNEPRILKDKAEDAGNAGYSVIARRIRGDQPGYITDAGQADQYEADMAEPDANSIPAGSSY